MDTDHNFVIFHESNLIKNLSKNIENYNYNFEKTRVPAKHIRYYSCMLHFTTVKNTEVVTLIKIMF